ncbi:MAG: hypothetical protein AAGH88_07465 [Planctomycetota bacterium]
MPRTRIPLTHLIATCMLAGLACLTGIAFADEQGAEQARLRQSLINGLQNSGYPVQEINDLLIRLELEPLDKPAPEDVVTEDDEGSPLYLPIGVTTELPLNEGQVVELPFVADGPGMLTIALWYEDGFYRAPLMVLNREGQSLNFERSDDSPEGIMHVPVGSSGAYRVQVTGGGRPLTIAAEWLPFPGMTSSNAQRVELPNIADMALLQPNTQIDVGITGNRERVLSFQPDTTGQLIVDVAANRGDLRLLVYLNFDMQNPQMSVDQDLEGDAGREVVSLPVTAGQLYQVVTSCRSDCTARVRTLLIPAPGEADPE